MATRVKTPTQANSQNIVAFSARSLYEQQNHGEVVSSTGGTNVIKSLMPDGIGLNSMVTGHTVDGLRADVPDANALSHEKRGRQDVPTADYVIRNSFKIGTKLLIKIEPTAKNTNLIEPMVFDKFSLQAISESDSERYQLTETFEDEVLYLFGRRPRVWTMQGIVINGRRSDMPTDEDLALFVPGDRADVIDYARQRNMDWANQLLMDWDSHYRGSKAIEAGARTYLAYDDSVIEATLLELVMTRNAQMPTAVNSTLTFVVHQRAFMGQSTDSTDLASLRDLISKTNTAGSFLERIKPSELSSDIELEEIKRQLAESETQLLEAQNKAQKTREEERLVTNEITAAETDRATNLATLAQATEDREAAEKALEDLGTSDEVLEQTIEEAKYREQMASEAAEAAYIKKQALEATLRPEDTDEAVENENDAVAINDTLASQSSQMAGQSVVIDEAYVQGIVQGLLTEGQTLSGFEYEQTDAGLIITYWVQTPNGAIALVHSISTSGGE